MLKLGATPMIFQNPNATPSNDILNSELKALKKSLFELKMKYDIEMQTWNRKMKALESKSEKQKKQIIDMKQQIQEEQNINKILKAEIKNQAHSNKKRALFLKVSYFILHCAFYNVVLHHARYCVLLPADDVSVSIHCIPPASIFLELLN